MSQSPVIVPSPAHTQGAGIRPVCKPGRADLGIVPATGDSVYLQNCPSLFDSFPPPSKTAFPSFTSRETKARGRGVICGTSKECDQDADLDLLASEARALSILPHLSHESCHFPSLPVYLLSPNPTAPLWATIVVSGTVQQPPTCAPSSSSPVCSPRS